MIKYKRYQIYWYNKPTFENDGKVYIKSNMIENIYHVEYIDKNTYRFHCKIHNFCYLLNNKSCSCLQYKKYKNCKHIISLSILHKK